MDAARWQGGIFSRVQRNESKVKGITSIFIDCNAVLHKQHS